MPTPDDLDRNRRILLIDDVPSVHDEFRRILGCLDEPSSRGFDLDSASQGGEALTMVRSSVETGRPYALAFVDLLMPSGSGGVETIREIWKVDPRLQIVICTSRSDQSWEATLGSLDAPGSAGPAPRPEEAFRRRRGGPPGNGPDDHLGPDPAGRAEGRSSRERRAGAEPGT